MDGLPSQPLGCLPLRTKQKVPERQAPSGQKKGPGGQGELGRGIGRETTSSRAETATHFQGRARQDLPETLGQPQSQPWRKWYLDWQGTVRQIRSGSGVPKGSSLGMQHPRSGVE